MENELKFHKHASAEVKKAGRNIGISKQDYKQLKDPRICSGHEFGDVNEKFTFVRKI